jgi:hypothetical protein
MPLQETACFQEASEKVEPTILKVREQLSLILQSHNWPLTNEELRTARRRFHNWQAIAARMAPKGQPVKASSKVRQQALTDIELMSSIEALLHRLAS